MPGAPARDRGLLVEGPRLCRGVESVLQERAVGEGDIEGHVLREARTRLDAVQQAGVVLTDQVLLHGAARAARADRVSWDSEALDEMLLDHHHGLCGDNVVGVVAEHVE